MSNGILLRLVQTQGGVFMKKLFLCALAATSITAAGCATVESSAEPAAARIEKEEAITGSRLRRNDPSAENYQGVKAVGPRDYEQYKAPQGMKGN